MFFLVKHWERLRQPEAANRFLTIAPWLKVDTVMDRGLWFSCSSLHQPALDSAPVPGVFPASKPSATSNWLSEARWLTQDHASQCCIRVEKEVLDFNHVIQK